MLNVNQNVSFSGDKYRVAWESKQTGAKGHGSPITQKEAQGWVDYENKKYPEIKHWVEKENEGDKFEAIG
ncbi:MAG: hypothetical protein WC197_09710 [Candidatus Gastranaerophilaceae bacterium]